MAFLSGFGLILIYKQYDSTSLWYSLRVMRIELRFSYLRTGERVFLRLVGGSSRWPPDVLLERVSLTDIKSIISPEEKALEEYSMWPTLIQFFFKLGIWLIYRFPSLHFLSGNCETRVAALFSGLAFLRWVRFLCLSFSLIYIYRCVVSSLYMFWPNRRLYLPVRYCQLACTANRQVVAYKWVMYLVEVSNEITTRVHIYRKL